MIRLNQLLVICILILFSCKKEQVVDNRSVFEEFWTYVDENYIYFGSKGVSWEQIKDDYSPMLADTLGEEALLNICIKMLNELKDGHNFIDTDFSDRKKYDYKEGYDIHFDLSVVENYYLNNSFQTLGRYTYGTIQDHIAYIHLSNFYGVGHIHEIMSYFEEKQIDGVIIDIRNNSGGTGQDVVEIIGHFIDQPTTVGYMIEKTGTAHDNFSEPLSIVATPELPFFDTPVVLLTNRSSYSASTYLASEMKDLENVTLIGQITGGGGGGNQTQELSNSWLITVSSSKLLDIHFDESIENGVAPDISVNNDSLTLASGIDQMLELAIQEF